MAGMEISADLDEELRVAVEQAVAKSFMNSFRLIMFIAAGLALAGRARGLVYD